MEIISDTKETLPPRAGEAITEIVKQYSETPILLMFSGGSALSIIEHIDAEPVTSNVTLTVLDERFGVDANDSNFAQLAETDFFAQSTKQGAYSIDPRGIPDEHLDEVAAWFDGALSAWRSKNKKGIVVITQGIGPDGHTAGILPFPEDEQYFQYMFNQTDRRVVGYNVSPEKNEFTQRITVTLPFLRSEVTSSIVYATGEGKKPILEAVTSQTQESVASMPARIIQDMNDVLILTDQNISQ